MLALQHVFVFVTDDRTDTMCRNNNHLFDHGLSGSIPRVMVKLYSASVSKYGKVASGLSPEQIELAFG